jgi:Tol biopolymer transport system component
MDRWRTGTVNLGTPMRLTELGAANRVDRDPFISADELTIYFSSDRVDQGLEDVYAATRSSLSAPFGTPVVRADISSPSGHDSRFTMTGNGMIGIVSSDRPLTEGGSDLWIATRTDVNGLFGTFTRNNLANVNGIGSELDPEISADGLHLYLARGGPQRIVVATRASTSGSFNTPQDVNGVNGDLGDADPTLSADERVIVWASRRSGGAGGDDLYYASRAGNSGAFQNAKLVPGVNTSFDDGDPALSADGCRLYFASFRTNDWELYVASMVP